MLNEHETLLNHIIVPIYFNDSSGNCRQRMCERFLILSACLPTPPGDGVVRSGMHMSCAACFWDHLLALSVLYLTHQMCEWDMIRVPSGKNRSLLMKDLSI